ncbi:LacI family DNA-binding transcriptional regulator [Micromonospora sp. WMMD1120]|uniref:LacI family DNA-binding transcriptional regulator n=1 Tax=Micromonospora sp. WMMD1120 TaxID=3016106 RepID=UPI0024178F6D|nr:LacI family DNA-binding transcriptional regulator [Micromonospora sp. WMMD1120]MDG4808433.1 LacI family DNA-binding transcriptional regulator [Micromonospora sp. WMMD1120]
MAEKVTIATVARHARVSRQTVSNVLNSPHIVRQETRERVEQAIAALGYRANQAARQMRTGRSRLIAARIEPTRDGINGSVLDRFLHGLTETADAAGYRVLLYTATDHDREIATYDDLLGTYELDAFVLVGTTHDDPRTAWLTERGVPFVTFGRPWDALDAHPWVDVDGAAGTALATRHLLDAGHRRIAFLGWPVGSGVGDDRRAGWHDTLRAAGVDPTGLHRETEDGIAEGERLMRDLVAAGPTAVVCASDSLALGALQAVRGVHPQVSVIGFDDTPVAAAVGLTSVSQPLGEAAARCVDLLTGVLDDDQTSAPVLLQPSLALRHTA